MARTFATNKKNVVTALRNLDNVSYFHKRQLVELNYLNAVPVPREGRGRPEVVYEVSNKGKNLLNLSRFWPA